MQIINANKDFLGTLEKFNTVVIDLGTGDGRFAYTTAKSNPEKLVIGIDPSQKQLEVYAKRANKERLENLFLIVGSVENIPRELIELGNEVYINFPWGSLLGGIANTDEKIIENICSLVRPSGTLQIIFGYSQNSEPSETQRLGIDNLSQEKINLEILPTFEKFGVQKENLVEVEKDEIHKINSSWGKKLSYGKDRPIFKLVLTKKMLP